VRRAAVDQEWRGVRRAFRDGLRWEEREEKPDPSGRAKKRDINVDLLVYRK
jgi:hypothetical protein